MARKKSVQKQARATRKTYNLRSKSKETQTVKVVPKNTKIKRKKPTRETPPTPTANPVEKVQSDVCAICLNTNHFKQHKTMECGHRFHTRCINCWFKVATSCPICRKPIKKSRIFQAAEHLGNPLLVPGDAHRNLPQVALFITVYRRQIGLV